MDKNLLGSFYFLLLLSIYIFVVYIFPLLKAETFAPKTMLLIIDMQKGFINEHTRHLPLLIENLQKKYENIVITKFYNKEKSSFRGILNWNGCSFGTEETELAFIPHSKAKIIHKPAYTCLTKKVKKFLKTKKIESVDIVGIDTDACVLKTAFDLFEYGITPYILENFCASSGGQQFHNHALEILRRNIGINQIKQS